jgi:hypothetical protein
MINKIKTLLHQTIQQGKYRMPCTINPDNQTEMNGFLLFYSDDLSTNIKTGKNTNSLFLSQGIEVAARQNEYSDARSLCLKAIKCLGQNREQINMSIWIKDAVPTYKGIDDTGGHVFSFTILVRGSEN